MGYDIPDKVRYREKIVFGLDGKQLVYAVLFGAGAFLAYGLPVEKEFRQVASSLVALMGLGFVFFGLEEGLKARLSYANALLLARNREKFAGRVIQVGKIERDALVLSNGELRAVLQVVPVNFALFDEDRKKSLVQNYRDFLNHLSHPVQVVVRTVGVRLDDYYASHEKRGLENDALKDLYEDFKEHENRFLKENEVKERGYFLVICLDPKAVRGQDAFRKLAERVAVVQDKLGECGIASRRLNDYELSAFIASYFAAGGENGA